MSDTLWVIAIAIVAGIANTLLGVFLVLRRNAMMGDAISHSVLFGLVMAYLITGSRSPLAMFIGAGVVGLLTAYLTSLLHRRGKLQEDASMGVVFTWLFALGVILIAAYAGQIDLDQDCVLNGEIAFAPFDRWNLIGFDIGPRTFWILATVAIANIVFVGTCFHRLRAVTFDPQSASAAGISIERWHYMFMTLVSLTVVASFEAVGAILVVALLVVPASTALLLSNRLINVLFIALAISVFASISGVGLAMQSDGSISAAVALMGGACFVLVLLSKEVLYFVAPRLRGSPADPLQHEKHI